MANALQVIGLNPATPQLEAGQTSNLDTYSMVSPLAIDPSGTAGYSGTNALTVTGNVSANALYQGTTNQARSGTSIQLTASSVTSWIITGSGGQTIILPDATTLPVGAMFTFNNNQSSGAITVNVFGSGSTPATVQSGGYATLTLLTKSVAAGTWDVHYGTPSNVTWSTNTLNYPGAITGVTSASLGSATVSGPITAKTPAATGPGLTVTGTSSNRPLAITDANSIGPLTIESNFSGQNIFEARNGAWDGDSAIGITQADPYQPTNANFIGSISANVLNVSTIISGGSIAVGQYLYGYGIPAGTYILSFGTGGGGTGTYNLSPPIGTTTVTAPLSTIAVTSASGTGTVATLNFGSISPVLPLGSFVVVSGMTVAGYNGTWQITATNATSIQFACTATGTATGTIQPGINAGSATEHFAVGYGGVNQAVSFFEASSFDGTANQNFCAADYQCYQTGGSDLVYPSIGTLSLTSGSTAVTSAVKSFFTGTISGTTLNVTATNFPVTAANAVANGSSITFTFTNAMSVAIPVGTNIVTAGFTFTGFTNGTFAVTASSTTSVTIASAATAGASSTAGTIASSVVGISPGNVIAGPSVTAGTKIVAIGPYGTLGATTGVGQYQIYPSQTVASATSFVAGVLPANNSLITPTTVNNLRLQPIAGGIPAGTTLTSGVGTFSGVLSAAATSTVAAQTAQFTAPSYGQKAFMWAYWYGQLGFINVDQSSLMQLDRQNKRVSIGTVYPPKATLDINGTAWVNSDLTMNGIMCVTQGQYNGGTGTTYTAAAGTANTLINDSGTPYAALTVVLPANPKPGQVFSISTTGGITALTVTAPSGTVLRATGNPTTLAAGSVFKWCWNQNTVWYPIG